MTPSDHLVLEIVLGLATLLATLIAFDFRWRFANEQSVSRDFERQRNEAREELELARMALAASVDDEAETLPPAA